MQHKPSPLNLFSRVKWLSFLLAVTSLLVTAYFISLDKPKIRSGELSSKAEIDQFQLMRNDSIWYRLNVERAYEKPVQFGSIHTSLLRVLALEDIRLLCTVDGFGIVTLEGKKGMIDLPMQRLRLHSPIFLSSSLGLSGSAQTVEINLQSGEIRLKNTQWSMGMDHHRLIEASWAMRGKTKKPKTGKP